MNVLLGMDIYSLLGYLAGGHWRTNVYRTFAYRAGL
jgi:hypothetical protein